MFENLKTTVKNAASRAKVLKEVWDERSYQDDKWGGKSFDNQHSEAEWLNWINEYANGTGRALTYDFRKRMIKVAALAVAAVEAMDAKAGKSA